MSLLDVSTLRAPPARRSLAELVTREKKRTKRRRLLAWALLATLPLLGFAVWLGLRPRPCRSPLSIGRSPSHAETLSGEVRATGHVEAVTTVQVGAEISGRIATVEVDFNEHVKQGQILARFDRAALAAQLAQTEATLAAARAALEQARTDRDRTARDRARVDASSNRRRSVMPSTIRPLLPRASPSSASRPRRRRSPPSRSMFAVSRTSLDHAVIHAPIDGVIITRNVDPGQTVASMLQTPVSSRSLQISGRCG